MPQSDETFDGNLLPRIAREALVKEFGGTARDIDIPAVLDEPGACFVTLRGSEGALRGCVGSIETKGSIVQSVRDHTLGAAFRDPRFPALAPNELDGLRISVSLLSPLQSVPASSLDELLVHLRSGLDGLVLRSGDRMATFLPQVWSELPDPSAFVDELLRKAGLDAANWPSNLSASVYQARSWSEP